MSRQKECSDGLRVALNMGGSAGQEHWKALRQKWLTQKKDRVILADLDLSGADLRNYDLSRCWIGRSSFVKANLSGASFSQSILRECDLTGANIRGTDFYAADLNHPLNRIVHTEFDDATNLEVNKGQLAPEMDRALIDMAAGAWRRTMWRRRRSNSAAYKVLSFITDHGFGLGRVASVSALTIIAFGISFYVGDPHVSVQDSLLISSRYFLGLEDHYSSTNPWLSLLGITEAVVGLILLAVLIAVFTSKFTDL